MSTSTAYEYELLARPPSTAIPFKGDNTHTITPIQPEDRKNLDGHSPVSATQNEGHHASSGKIWRKSRFSSHSKAQDKGKSPTVALNRSPGSLAISFVVHLVPVIITAAIVQLSFRSVFWFDVEDTTTNRIRISRWAIGLNEFLNILQFLAKIHELLLVASLSAIVLHFVQVFLVGSTGLPFGLLSAGYAVDNPKYILTKAFWSSALNRTFCLFCGLLVIGTALANVVGPSSAIVLIPNLDWWPVQDPYSGEKLPVGFFYNASSLWPTEVSSLQAQLIDSDEFTPDVCATSKFKDLDICPASGWDALHAFTFAYSSEGVDANITIIDGESGAKRVVKSRLTTRQGSKPAVAITTSLNRNLAITMSSFWQYIRTRLFGINQMARPKLTANKDTPSYQPLVQVQCIPYLLPEYNDQISRGAPIPTSLNILNGTGNMVDSLDLNDFSRSSSLVNHSWPIPAWLNDYRYTPNITVINNKSIAFTDKAVDLIWVDIVDHESASASIAAIVVTPFSSAPDPAKPDDLAQFALAHACTINARWIASSPSYDPILNSEIQHNITDPLVFRKDISDPVIASTYGIGQTIAIESSWANFLNPPLTMEQTIPQANSSNSTEYSLTSGAFQWLVDEFLYAEIQEANNDSNVLVEFVPAYNFAQNVSGLSHVGEYGKAVSETISTVLGMLVTDGLARISSQRLIGVELQSVGGNLTIINLLGFSGGGFFQSEYNDTAAEFARNLPYTVLIDVDRYGYGYGTQSRTVQFGIAVLFFQALIAAFYLVYVTYLFCNGGWMSGAWSDMGELAAMMIHPFHADQDESVERSGDKMSGLPTSTQRVRIRELDDDHLGVVIGEKYEMLGAVQPGKKYNGSGLKLRRKSF